MSLKHPESICQISNRLLTHTLWCWTVFVREGQITDMCHVQHLLKHWLKHWCIWTEEFVDWSLSCVAPRTGLLSLQNSNSFRSPWEFFHLIFNRMPVYCFVNQCAFFLLHFFYYILFFMQESSFADLHSLCMWPVIFPVTEIQNVDSIIFSSHFISSVYL